MSNFPRATRYASLSLKDLVCLCAEPGDDEAWEEFISRIAHPIGFAIRRTASRWGKPSLALVEDIRQITYLKLWEGGRRLLRDFAMQRPDGILAYLKRTAANSTHDYFRHGYSQSAGGKEIHVSTADVDPEARVEADGSQEKINREVFLAEIDQLLKGCLTGPDQNRDRTIFWLYFRQGMSTKEIAALPTIGLSAKGVGSVIERLKQALREQIINGEPDAMHASEEKQIP